MLITERAKNLDRGSLCSAHESTGSKLQHEPYLFSEACSKTKQSISAKNLGNQVKGHSPKKIKLLIEFPYVAHLKIQVLSLNMKLFYSP